MDKQNKLPDRPAGYKESHLHPVSGSLSGSPLPFADYNTLTHAKRQSFTSPPSPLQSMHRINRILMDFQTD